MCGQNGIKTETNEINCIRNEVAGEVEEFT